jgi:hypothetical protein
VALVLIAGLIRLPTSVRTLLLTELRLENTRRRRVTTLLTGKTMGVILLATLATDMTIHLPDVNTGDLLLHLENIAITPTLAGITTTTE